MVGDLLAGLRSTKREDTSGECVDRRRSTPTDLIVVTLLEISAAVEDTRRRVASIEESLKKNESGFLVEFDPATKELLEEVKEAAKRLKNTQTESLVCAESHAS